jgi:hypothetical protein
MIFIAVAMAYVDFDDPAFVAVSFAVIDALVVLATWERFGWRPASGFSCASSSSWLRCCTQPISSTREVFAKQYHGRQQNRQ